ncbi:hypothetical protein FC62_GL001144 [Amylolactobacillus amylotrophicus DSM 20534]|uniref:Uncharacterized protein n=3 Tax=Amylolactobacillus TaxID=2767876 RepID=A0A1L6XCG2_9LACO|nr:MULTISPECIES: DUF2273 domain-containing protein [Amylolactobacillus]APT18629.1 hypothetical protein LA20533_04845 [Amylolactobacillus amylophilus DSM 20533 = JCM 1125]KRK37809.1 hypothetical protein FC62_GL001144 [Amylolactobacillus amylotrophicus DSM 20534]KRM41597.1 hypothetical protein FD40_GL001439 [Amylolactobacillus amylophilus DSM 20533 = JCM 1125]GED81048.1 membrane protein [Amylolactobacillus amylophilus]
MEEMIRTYRFPIIGAVVGLILATLIFTIGFWKTILVLILTVLGAYLAFKLQQSGILQKIKQNSTKKRGSN